MFDRVIVASDDSHFLDFWPLVAKAWKKFFNVRVTLAFVSDVVPDHRLFELSKHGEVVRIQPSAGVPLANQAKLARFHLAANKYSDEVVMIEDIDTLPLQKKYFEEVTSKRPPNKLLMVGHEVYVEPTLAGKCPVSTMTSEQSVFAELMNPENLEFRHWVQSFRGWKKCDKREDPFRIPTDFSDESLLRAILINKDAKIHKERRRIDPKNDWIDRSKWRMDKTKLFSGGYVCVNLKRPLEKSHPDVKLIEEYIGS